MEKLKRFLKTCDVCGKEFASVQLNARFCSNICNQKMSRANTHMAAVYSYRKACVICGKHFKTKSRIKISCSAECSKKALQYAHRMGFNRKFKKILDQKECSYCKKMFEPKEMKQKYCSPRCLNSFHSNDFRRDQALRESKGSIIYHGYKESVMPMLPPYYGYEGMILEDITIGKIQCSICGCWYKSLASHLKIHDKIIPRLIPGSSYVDAYKDLCQLLRKTPLVSSGTREKMLSQACNRPLHPALVKNKYGGYRKGRNGRAPCGNAKTQAHHNTDTCFQQCLDAIQKISIKLGRTPYSREIVHRDGKHLSATIRNKFGSYTNACKLLKLKPTDRNHGTIPLTKGFLIRCLIGLYERKKRRPSLSDCNSHSLPSEKCFRDVFGSFRAAVNEALATRKEKQMKK